MTAKSDKRRWRWIIWVSGWDMYEYVGTEAEAEEHRCEMARGIQAVAKKFNLGLNPNAEQRDGIQQSGYGRRYLQRFR